MSDKLVIEVDSTPLPVVVVETWFGVVAGERALTGLETLALAQAHWSMGVLPVPVPPVAWLVRVWPQWPTDVELRSADHAVGVGPRFFFEGDGTHVAGGYVNDNIGSTGTLVPPTKVTD